MPVDLSPDPRRVSRCGRLLRHDLGLRPGDVAAILSPNRAEVIELALGALHAGVWLAHLDPKQPPARRDALLDVARPGAVFAARGVDAPDGAIQLGAPLARLLSRASDAPFSPDGPPGGTLHFTSGTTGQPKGLRRTPAPTLGAEVARRVAYARAVGMDGRGPHLVCGPLCHAAPLGFALAAHLAGAPLVIMERFDAAEALATLTRRAIRSTHLVPTMLRRFLALPAATREAFDPRALTCALHGAAPIGLGEKARILAWWGPRLTEYWGASEVGVITLARAGEWSARPGTVGRPLQGWSIAVQGPDGEALPPGVVGRLVASRAGAGQLFTYLGDAPQPAPGVFETGDLGRLDADGFLSLAGRADDVVLSGGVNVYPAEVEAALMAHPAVVEAAVCGLPDPEWGEVVAAAVVASVTPAALSAWCRARLGSIRAPRVVICVAALPRTPGGKVARAALRRALKCPGR